MSADAIVPILILAILIAVGVGCYVVVQRLPEIRQNFSESLKGRNIDVSGSGVKLTMKEVPEEDYLYRLQRYVIHPKLGMRMRSPLLNWIRARSGMLRTYDNSHLTPAEQTKRHRLRRFEPAHELCCIVS